MPSKVKSKGYADAMDLYRAFIADMQAFAVVHKKTLMAWEGFGPAGGQGGHKPANASKVAIPTAQLVVNVFDGVYYNPPKLASDGYKIINSATASRNQLLGFHRESAREHGWGTPTPPLSVLSGRQHATF